MPRLMTWAPCAACRLEVHLPVAQFLLVGLHCPSCGAELLAPPVDAQARLQRLLHDEDRLLQETECD